MRRAEFVVRADTVPALLRSAADLLERTHGQKEISVEECGQLVAALSSAAAHAKEEAARFQRCMERAGFTALYNGPAPERPATHPLIGLRAKAVGLPCADRNRVGTIEQVRGQELVLHFDGDSDDAPRHVAHMGEVEILP